MNLKFHTGLKCSEIAQQKDFGYDLPAVVFLDIGEGTCRMSRTRCLKSWAKRYSLNFANRPIVFLTCEDESLMIDEMWRRLLFLFRFTRGVPLRCIKLDINSITRVLLVLLISVRLGRGDIDSVLRFLSSEGASMPTSVLVDDLRFTCDVICAHDQRTLSQGSSIRIKSIQPSRLNLSFLHTFILASLNGKHFCLTRRRSSTQKRPEVFELSKKSYKHLRTLHTRLHLLDERPRTSIVELAADH